MTIAIVRENSTLIWLDAVTDWGRQYSSSVTKHRIETGSSITDHVIEENPVFTVSGVITGVDFGSTKPTLTPEDEKAYNILSQKNAEEIREVIISTSGVSSVTRFLPESIRQFLGSDEVPVVDVQLSREQEADILISAEVFLSELVMGSLVFENGKSVKKKELVTLLEFDAYGKIINSYDNCVLTSLSFKEDAGSGYALYPTMTFEKVRFVSLVTTTIPKKVAAPVKNKVTEVSDKGKQQPPATATDTSESLNAEKKPTKVDNKSIADSFKNDKAVVKK